MSMFLKWSFFTSTFLPPQHSFPPSFDSPCLPPTPSENFFFLCSTKTVIMFVVSLLPQAPPHKYSSEQLCKMAAWACMLLSPNHPRFSWWSCSSNTEQREDKPWWETYCLLVSMSHLDIFTEIACLDILFISQWHRSVHAPVAWRVPLQSLATYVINIQNVWNEGKLECSSFVLFCSFVSVWFQRGSFSLSDFRESLSTQNLSLANSAPCYFNTSQPVINPWHQTRSLCPQSGLETSKQPNRKKSHCQHTLAVLLHSSLSNEKKKKKTLISGCPATPESNVILK